MPPAAARITPGEGGVGAGEGALAVAEQLALEHVARDGGAVEGQERPVGAVRGAVDGAREHFLAGAGLAGEEDAKRGRRDAARDREQLGHLLGDPDALGVAVERLGGPQRGALLLLAAVAVERERGVDQLADRDQRAAVFELGPRIDEELPGLVAMCADRDHVVVGGLAAAAAASRSFQPCARSRAAGRVPGDEGDGVRQPPRRARRAPRARGCADVRPVPAARRRCRGRGAAEIADPPQRRSAPYRAQGGPDLSDRKATALRVAGTVAPSLGHRVSESFPNRNVY